MLSTAVRSILRMAFNVSQGETLHWTCESPSDPTASIVSSSIRIDLELNCFSPPCCYHSGLNHHDLLQSLPGWAPRFQLWFPLVSSQLRSVLSKYIDYLLAQNLSRASHITQSKAKVLCWLSRSYMICFLPLPGSLSSISYQDPSSYSGLLAIHQLWQESLSLSYFLSETLQVALSISFLSTLYSNVTFLTWYFVTIWFKIEALPITALPDLNFS